MSKNTAKIKSFNPIILSEFITIDRTVASAYVIVMHIALEKGSIMDTINYQDFWAKNIADIENSRGIKAPSRAKYDFAIAYPDPDTLPLEELSESIRSSLLEQGRNLAIYPDPLGYEPLRHFINAKIKKTRNIDVDPNQILLTNGSLEALRIVANLVIDPGDIILTEDYTYRGALDIFRQSQALTIGIECDSEGMIPEYLDKKIQLSKKEKKRIKLVYTIPTFQNPQGQLMGKERRLAILDITKKHGIPILEDDCYADLAFDQTPDNAIFSLDTHNSTLYLGSYSKIIAPGIRLGFLVADHDVIKKSMVVKSGGGYNELIASAVNSFSHSYLEKHINKINKKLKTKRDAMLASLSENLSGIGNWNQPKGGLYLWLKMPPSINLSQMQQLAFNSNIGYLSGNVWAADQTSGQNLARLCFGYNTPEEIDSGISQLTKILENEGHIS